MSSYFLKSGVLTLAALIAFLVSYPHLPEHVPLHWNFQGAVNGYGPRYALLLLGPGMMLGQMVFFGLLPRLSPKHFEMHSSRTAYLYLMLLIVSFSGYLFAVLLWAALVDSAGVPQSVLGGLSIFTILIGKVLGKVKRNYFIGIRTPWTLASERVWCATHLMAAQLMFVTGAIGLSLALLGIVVWVGVAVLSFGFLAPVGYSLFYYMRLKKRGELDDVD